MYTIVESNMQSKDSPESVSVLVAEAKANPVAFSGLYEHYVQPVYRYLYSRLGTRPVAEDLTSQTFIAAYEALPRYRERGHFSAWLFRIAQSKLMDYFRARRFEIEWDSAENTVDRQDVLTGVIQDEEIGRLRSLIQSLPANEQDLIRLRYVAELSYSEMAELLGKREDAIRKSVQRLLARLKSQME